MLTIHNNSYVYDGLSSETKPTENIPNGTIFHEIDTGDNYQFNEDAMTWIKQPTSGGGGGGSDLPDVTAADNGKVLGVVNGNWNKMDNPGKEQFVVNLTIDDAEDLSGTMDKTSNEINAAYRSGKEILFNFTNYSSYDDVIFTPAFVTTPSGSNNVSFDFYGTDPTNGIFVHFYTPAEDNYTSYYTAVYYLFTEQPIEHDYTVTYADDTTATLKNVEVV